MDPAAQAALNKFIAWATEKIGMFDMHLTSIPHTGWDKGVNGSNPRCCTINFADSPGKGPGNRVKQ